jgi:hypothetical protein
MDCKSEDIGAVPPDEVLWKYNERRKKMLTINLLIILGGAALLGLFLLIIKKLDQREDFDTRYRKQEQWRKGK